LKQYKADGGGFDGAGFELEVVVNGVHPPLPSDLYAANGGGF